MPSSSLFRFLYAGHPTTITNLFKGNYFSKAALDIIKGDFKNSKNRIQILYFFFFLQDGPILVFNSDENSAMVSEIRRHFLPSLTLLALNDIVVDKNDALQGLVIEPGTGVLIDSAGKKSVISNVEQVKELMK